LTPANGRAGGISADERREELPLRALPFLKVKNLGKHLTTKH
jgi:hypothetical protein